MGRGEVALQQCLALLAGSKDSLLNCPCRSQADSAEEGMRLSRSSYTIVLLRQLSLSADPQDCSMNSTSNTVITAHKCSVLLLSPCLACVLPALQVPAFCAPSNVHDLVSAWHGCQPAVPRDQRPAGRAPGW